MAFQNVALTYKNFSFGPDSGRIYSIDHLNDVLLVKTYPGGSLVSTIPLDTNINNEVIELQYDGYYFYTLSSLGSLGMVINKWKLNSSSTILEKQVGIGNEINLLNSPSFRYESKAFCIHIYKTYTQFFIPVGSTQATLGNVDLLSIGDSIYFGPSSASLGERRERTITGILGNIVFFSLPLDVSFNTNDQIIYRKNIWVFNDYENGSLIQIDSYLGWELTRYTSTEWKHVTASTSYNGNLVLVRESQLLFYKPFGINSGYQTSYHLSNISADKSTVFTVEDIEIDSTNIYKLQNKRRIFNVGTLIFEDETSTTNKYEIDQEILAQKVTSVTAKRKTNSILFGNSINGDFTVKVLDQYNNPLSGRNISVSDDDSSGTIPAGFITFTTNTQGEGNTRYNTGTTPTFRQPTITAKDVSTSYNVKILVDQVPNKSNISFIEQVKGPTSLKLLEQINVRSLAPIINQVSGTVSNTFIEQTQPKNTLPIIQDQLTKSGSIVTQDGPAEDITLIEQYGDIEDFTTIEQYEFLFYAFPTPYSIKNPIDTDIIVRIIGFGGIPLNSNTLVFKVNGIDITTSVVVTSFGSGLELKYNPSINFPYSSTVTIFISIKDTDTIPREVSTYYTFDIVSDYKKPILYQVYPPDRSIDNLPNTEIYAIIKDLETGININSIELYIEGRKVNHTTEMIDAETYKVSYQTNYNFAYQSNISASVFVKDLEDNQLIGSWSFNIKSSSGVLFTNMNPSPCSVLVPVDANICTEIYGLEDGINLNTLEFTIEGKKIIYLIKPKIIRTE